jgi:hypothetical protein
VQLIKIVFTFYKKQNGTMLCTMKTTNRESIPFNEGLTYEKLKTYKGFENITEQEAEREIEIIRRLAKILYYIYMNEQQNKEGSEYED